MKSSFGLEKVMNGSVGPAGEEEEWKCACAAPLEKYPADCDADAEEDEEEAIEGVWMNDGLCACE